MISVSQVSKVYPSRSGPRKVLDDVCIDIPPGSRVGILGRNGSGKSTLVRLISGAEEPTSGSIHRSMSVSWPLAFGGAFQGSLTGADNIRFISRVYNCDEREIVRRVDDFAELGRALREPVNRYSSGMQARLAFGLSMAIKFDCLLIDEIIAVGDAHFQEKCRNALLHSERPQTLVLVSHDPGSIMQYCDRASVIHLGKLENFDDVQSAYDFYNQLSPA